MSEALFTAYPELARRITALCGGATWCVTGASALVQDGEGAHYFEIAKPKHWQTRPDGAIVVGVGAIGGSLQAGEGILTCLQREAQEEIGAPLRVVSATAAHLVYEEALAASLSPEQRAHPLPALFTISRNLYRQGALPGYEVLAIATFLARLDQPPRLADLFGLLSVPVASLRAFFRSAELALAEARNLPGLQLCTQEPLPPQTILRPIWTARSLQKLLQAGLAIAGPGDAPPLAIANENGQDAQEGVADGCHLGE